MHKRLYHITGTDVVEASLESMSRRNRCDIIELHIIISFTSRKKPEELRTNISQFSNTRRNIYITFKSKYLGETPSSKRTESIVLRGERKGWELRKNAWSAHVDETALTYSAQTVGRQNLKSHSTTDRNC